MAKIKGWSKDLKDGTQYSHSNKIGYVSINPDMNEDGSIYWVARYRSKNTGMYKDYFKTKKEATEVVKMFMREHPNG